MMMANYGNSTLVPFKEARDATEDRAPGHTIILVYNMVAELVSSDPRAEIDVGSAQCQKPHDFFLS